MRERGKFENPGGLALPSFGKLAPLCPALTERDRERMEADMAERLNMAREVAALKRMSVKELRGRYVEVFGEATRSGNKDRLWKHIA